MEEVRRSEQRATVEDLMYASVLEKFVEVGVDMMPKLDNTVESPATLKVRLVLYCCSSQPQLKCSYIGHFTAVSSGTVLSCSSNTAERGTERICNCPGADGGDTHPGGA